MTAWLSRLIVAGVVLATARPVLADDPNFADLLARAEAQAAAGHRWAPSGDNMTETVAAMMKLISSATPEQLAELSNLLERDATRLPHPATKSAAISEPAAPAAAEPDPADEKSDVPPLDSDRPIEQPTAPATRFKLDKSVERPAVSAATSQPEGAMTLPVVPATTSEPDRRAPRPDVQAVATEPERAITRPGALAAPAEPSSDGFACSGRAG
jgi:hypothetical protein